MDIGERIQKIRDDVAREKFAPALGISKNTLVNYEKCVSAPTSDFLNKLLVLYPDISPTWLLTGEGYMYRGEHAGGTSAVEEESGGECSGLPARGGEGEFHLGMGDSIELLVNIHKSGNNVLIRAINANLMAFNEAIENRHRAEAALHSIAEIQEQINIMKGEMNSLRQANQELQRKLLLMGGFNENQEAVG